MPHRAASDRLATVVDALEMRAGDRVVEIGCGHGVAAGSPVPVVRVAARREEGPGSGS